MVTVPSARVTFVAVMNMSPLWQEASPSGLGLLTRSLYKPSHVGVPHLLPSRSRLVVVEMEFHRDVQLQLVQLLGVHVRLLER